MQKNSLSGVSRGLTKSTSKKVSAPSVVVSAVSSNDRSGDRNLSVLENTLKEMRENAPSPSSSVVMKESELTVGGGVEDVYGEDSATEDQYITPWTVTVARLGIYFLVVLFLWRNFYFYFYLFIYLFIFQLIQMRSLYSICF